MRACRACLSIFASEPEFCVFDGLRLPPGDETLVGRVLGGYRITGLLGVGSTGCVFRGAHVSTGRPCALKLLYGEMATDPNVAERFRREAEAVRRIDHPNIVKILDTGHSSVGLPYIVMELIEGPTLKTVIEEHGPLDARRVGRIAEQLVAGLAEAHHQGFVHRDLKPGNIIVSPDGPGELIKILDFGIVASLQRADEDPKLTKTGYIVGTPTYMAPEQVDPRGLGPQADVYALGVILYELLAGQPPFDGSLEQILVAKITETPAPLPHAGELGRLVLSLLEPNPDLRLPNALRVSAELSRISLLSDDPATVRADAVHPTIEDAGFPTGTVRLIDRTLGTEAPDEDDDDEDQWVGDTNLDPLPTDPDLTAAALTAPVVPVDPTTGVVSRELDTTPEPGLVPEPPADPVPAKPAARRRMWPVVERQGGASVGPSVSRSSRSGTLVARFDTQSDAVPYIPPAPPHAPPAPTPTGPTEIAAKRPPMPLVSAVDLDSPFSPLDAAVVSPDYADQADWAVTAATDWEDQSSTSARRWTRLPSDVATHDVSAPRVPYAAEPAPPRTERGAGFDARVGTSVDLIELTEGLTLAGVSPNDEAQAEVSAVPTPRTVDAPSVTDAPARSASSVPPPIRTGLPPPLFGRRAANAPPLPFPEDCSEDVLDSADTAFQVSRPALRRPSAQLSVVEPAPEAPPRPAWAMIASVLLLLTLSALAGFYLATNRETVLVDAPVIRAP